MASNLIGALRVTLGLDSATFMSGATAAERRAYLMGERIGKSLRAPIDAASSLKTAMLALGGSAVVATVTAAVSRALDYASSLGEVSQQLGVASQDLQEYRYAASQAGIAQDVMDKSLAKLTLTMGKAREGAAAPKAAFKELSDILGRDILKNAATAGDAIPLIADALAKVPDPARRAAMEVGLFGKSGQQLDTLLAGGAGAINELRDAAHSLGLVLSEDQIQKADQTADKLAELKQVLEARIAGAVADNANAILDLTTALEKLMGKIPAFLQQWNNFLMALDNARLQSDRIGNLAAIGSPFTDPGQKAEAAARNVVIRNRLAKNQVRGLIDNAPANSRQALLGLLGSKARSELGYGAPSLAISSGRRSPTPGAGAGMTDAERSAASRAAAKADRDAARAAEEAKRRDRAYREDLTRAQVERLRAEQDLTVEQIERAAFEREMLAKDHAQRLDSIATNDDLNAAQKAELTAIENKTYALQSDLINRRENEEIAREELALANSRLDNEQDVLRATAEFARTSRARRDIELRLLDLQFRQLNLEQDRIIASRDSTEAEKQIATERKKTLGQLRGLAKASVIRQTQGPLAQYLDDLPRTADEMNEALQRVQVEGLRGVSDGLADVIAGTRSLGDVFTSITNQIIADLARIAIQKGISSLLKNVLGVSTPTSGGEGSFLNIFGQIAGKRANGGSVLAGKTYLVGERGPELFSPASTGRIIANDDLPTGRAIEIVVHADEGALFVPRVEAISDGVAVSRIGQAKTASARAGRRRIGR